MWEVCDKVSVIVPMEGVMGVCVCTYVHFCTCMWMQLCLVDAFAWLWVGAHMYMHACMHACRRKCTIVGKNTQYSSFLGFKLSNKFTGPCMSCTCIHHASVPSIVSRCAESNAQSSH